MRRAVAEARTHLTADAARKAWKAGRAMTADQALAFGLARDREDDPT